MVSIKLNSLSSDNSAPISPGRHILRLPIERHANANNLDICYFEWEADSNSTVLLLHATGFHARCWDTVVKKLTVPSRVIAVDLRGHGRTEKQAPYDWNTISEDIVALVDHLELQDLIVAGHSMGGRCALYLAARRPNVTNSLLLLDPVVLSPAQYEESPAATQAYTLEEHPVARRRNTFESPQAMVERFEHRKPFNRWQSQVLQDYCEFGLRLGERGFELCCPPSVEAQIYAQSAATSIHDLLPGVKQPTKVIRAKERTEPRIAVDFSGSPTWPGLADALPNGTDCYRPELSHFIPMECPDLVANEIDRLLQAS